MGKFLVILSIVLTAASAVLGYLNYGKLQEAKKSLVDTEVSANQARTQLAKTRVISSPLLNLATTAAEDQLAAKLSAIQSDLEKTKDQAAALGNDKTALEAQVAQLTSDLQSKTQESEQRERRFFQQPQSRRPINRRNWPNSRLSSPSCSRTWTPRAPSFPP